MHEPITNYVYSSYLNKCIVFFFFLKYYSMHLKKINVIFFNDLIVLILILIITDSHLNIHVECLHQPCKIEK